MFRKKEKARYVRLVIGGIFLFLLMFLMFASPSPDTREVTIKLTLEELGAKQYE